MLKELDNYTPGNPSLWQGREESLPAQRFYQLVQCEDVRSHQGNGESGRCLIGFACDEGVKRNLGRVGAKEGPDAIRGQLAKLACHTQAPIVDFGNISCPDDKLEQAQQGFASLVSQLHQLGHKTYALGGGHEIAWAHFKGLSDHYSSLGIINFDAHFDIRPYSDGKASSGTPFSQVKAFCDEQSRPFGYCCLGIEPNANTPALFNTAQEWNIPFLPAKAMQNESLAWQTAFLDNFLFAYDHIYLTICMDVFNASAAPGVSAPQPLGLDPSLVIPLLKYIQQSGKVVGIDIAEFSPRLDETNKTAHLAASLLGRLLSN